MEIDRYYYRNRKEAEEKANLSRFGKGRNVRIGETYPAMTSRDGSVLEGPFQALAYENGILFLGKPDGRTFAEIRWDAVAEENGLYMERLPILAEMRKEIGEILGTETDEEKCVTALRLSCGRKGIIPLSEEGAEMLLRWYRSTERGW